jgi:inner membrane protein
MFIGLVFLTYFLFEATSQIRAHPAQYVLVGLAQTVFYMLLLSISEVAGFNFGFLIAATATVLMLSLYAGSVFVSRWAAAKALAAFSAIYSLIYVLMRQEDYGLLVGSIASFLAIAGTMWMTRNLDWYGVGRTSSAPQAQASV